MTVSVKMPQTALRISVAMATYNGSRFIVEQLTSLCAQKVLPFELVVCDDGSGDGTPEMVEAFATTAPFPVRVYRNEHNLGFAENFLKAARLCEGDWVAFCDQDDVWLPSKIERAAEAIAGNPGLTLILQNAYICDGDLRHEGRIFPDVISPGLYGERSQSGFWVWPGFLQTVRSELFYLASVKPLPANYYPGDKLLTHDKWSCLVANALGGVQVIGAPVALYRRHSTALTGDWSRQTSTQKVSKALSVGSSQYDFLADVAKQTAVYLREMAAFADANVGEALLRSARSFDTIESIHAYRAALYSATAVPTRLSCLAGIAAKGGYIGPRISALGWRSGVKDMLHAFGLFGLLRRVLR